MIKIVLRHPGVLLLEFYTAIVVVTPGSISEVAAEEAEAIEEALAETNNNPLAMDNFSATIWLTTDYVDRGISNTDEGPAIQASLDWGYNGFYLGVWGSNTRYSDAGVEIDYYGGYTWEWKGLSFDAGADYYHYPGEDENRGDGLDPDGGQEADYWETSIGISHAFEGWLSPVAGVTYFYSPDFFGEDGAGHALAGNLELSLPYEFIFGMSIGYQVVAGDKLSTGYNYHWWQVGMSREISGFNLDLSYHDVDDELEACGGYLCDGRVAFTISRTF